MPTSNTPAGTPEGTPHEPLPSKHDFEVYGYEEVNRILGPYLRDVVPEERRKFFSIRIPGLTLSLCDSPNTLLRILDVPATIVPIVWSLVQDIRNGTTHVTRKRRRSSDDLGEEFARRRGAGESMSRKEQAYFAMIVAAKELKKLITSLEYDRSDFAKLGTLMEIPFPSIGRPPGAGRFNLAGVSLDIDASESGLPSGPKAFTPNSFGFYGRQIFDHIYEEVMGLNFSRGNSMYYVHGSSGYGKSHILAALVALMMKEGKPVVYIPDCRQLARDFSETLREALILTFSENEQLQKEIADCTSAMELVAWCRRRAQAENQRLYFVIDQINILDTAPAAIDSVGPDERKFCAQRIAELGSQHILIYSSTGNYQFGLKKKKSASIRTLTCYGGLTDEEMALWWASYGTKWILEERRPDAEALTGRLPMLLRALLEVMPAAPPIDNLTDESQLTPLPDEIEEEWQKTLQKFLGSEPVELMREQIALYYLHIRMDLASNPGQAKWKEFLQCCNACLTGTTFPLRTTYQLLDRRYFFRDVQGKGACTCHIARETLADLLRPDLNQSNFRTSNWRQAMAAAGPNNATVLGFFTEQALLSDIVHNGLSLLGPGWKKIEYESFDGIPNLPAGRNTFTILYVPTASNFKAIDAMLIRLTRQTLKIVPIQVTISASLKDFEQDFFLNWEKYASAFAQVAHQSIEIQFLWIVETVPATISPIEQVPEGTATLRGATDTAHPAYTRRWATVKDVSVDVGNLLARARGRD